MTKTVTETIETTVNPNNVLIVGRDTQDREEHPLYDPRGLRDPDPARVASIKQYGVLVPVRLRRMSDPETDLECLYAVDGRGRVLAARAAGLKAIPAVIENGGVTWRDFALSRVLNQHEQDDTLTRAAAARRLMAGMLLEHPKAKRASLMTAAAKAFGVTPESIRQWLVLLEQTAPEVQAAVQTGQISPTAGVVLAQLPAEDQPGALAAVCAAAPDGPPTVEAVKEAVRAKTGSGLGTPGARIRAAGAFLTGWAIRSRQTGHQQTVEQKYEDAVSALNVLADKLLGLSLADLGGGQ